MFGSISLFNPWVILGILAGLSTAYLWGDHNGAARADRSAEIRKLERDVRDLTLRNQQAEAVRVVLEKQFRDAKAIADEARAAADAARADATLFKERVDALVGAEETKDDHHVGDLFDAVDVDLLRPFAEGAAGPSRVDAERGSVAPGGVRPAGSGAKSQGGAE